MLFFTCLYVFFISVFQSLFKNKSDLIYNLEIHFTPPHTHFCKRKKEKKESGIALWRVSKKQVFWIKYYSLKAEWRFYPEPKA